MNELTTVTRGELVEMVAQMDAAAKQSAALLKSMSMTIAAMGAEIKQIRKEMARMIKMTPVQVSEINEMVRDRAAQLCVDYRLPDERERAVNARIRSGIKAQFGGAVKECSAEDYSLIKQYVRDWEDTPALKKMRRN